MDQELEEENIDDLPPGCGLFIIGMILLSISITMFHFIL